MAKTQKNMEANDNQVRGRFAPSPTGLMHVGNARTALVAWLSVRQKQGVFVWRLEDIDTPRVVTGMAEAAEEDLAWLGIDWDEGPAKGGIFSPYSQSQRSQIYEEALEALLAKDQIFPCEYSRKDLQSLASAPHGHEGLSPYPVSLRPARLDTNWFEALSATQHPYASIRYKVQTGKIVFEDLLQGVVAQDVLNEVGDFVIKRRDGMYAYQLAVVVDDIAMEISEVVRGMDLIDSTARQIQLIRSLGGKIPLYAHVPLVLNDQREKLSKRDEGLTLRSLREAGIKPAQLRGYLAYTLGLIDEIIPVDPGALIELFRWDAIGSENWILPADIVSVLRRI